MSISLSFSFPLGVISLKNTGFDSKEKEGLVSLYPSDFDCVTWPSLYMNNICTHGKCTKIRSD